MKSFDEIVDQVVGSIEDTLSVNHAEGMFAKDIVQAAFAEWIAEHVLQGVELISKREERLYDILSEVHITALVKSMNKE